MIPFLDCAMLSLRNILVYKIFYLKMLEEMLFHHVDATSRGVVIGDRMVSQLFACSDFISRFLKLFGTLIFKNYFSVTP